MPGPKVSKLLDLGVLFLQPPGAPPSGPLSAKAREHPPYRDQDHSSFPGLGWALEPSSVGKGPKDSRAKPLATTQKWSGPQETAGGRDRLGDLALPLAAPGGIGSQTAWILMLGSFFTKCGL